MKRTIAQLVDHWTHNPMQPFCVCSIPGPVRVTFQKVEVWVDLTDNSFPFLAKDNRSLTYYCTAVKISRLLKITVVGDSLDTT